MFLGYAVYVFDIQSTSGENVFGKLEKGRSKLSARFGTALPEAVTAIVYGKFPSEFKIDKSRAVMLE